MSYKEMAKLFSLTDRGIRLIANKYNLKIRNGNEQYNVNKDFFKSWTNEMAWVLAMIYTDGCIHDTVGNRSFDIAQKDTNILHKIRDLLGSNHKIIDGYKNRSACLNIGSTEMVNDLKSYGMTPNKSRSIKFPDVPELYLPHFIRGVIDGDGWVKPKGSVLNVTSASKDFAESLCNVFKSWGLNSEIRTQTSDAGTTIYRIWVIGIFSVWKLSSIIYHNCGDLYIDYKRKRMEYNQSRIKRVYDRIKDETDFDRISNIIRYYS
ncbi:hypothetical protein A8F94_05425 [Bacillus sp. FJAT-27225]|uniref:LAGLIDADG family homing endonuclease n=1 Tax=Bacillus sp. FJAT-27225 TaxID=1743144 RepID=UPI00080C340D|nr:LAGLIDADG family homing endonuclease [Bacillus sp. FJAT-27225]OCA91301.1 hypothetical protein A8F94_05425 [Bacillus sp. FJAT-27225]